jgi:hypothetical protein
VRAPRNRIDRQARGVIGPGFLKVGFGTSGSAQDGGKATPPGRPKPGLNQGREAASEILENWRFNNILARATLACTKPCFRVQQSSIHRAS